MGTISMNLAWTVKLVFLKQFHREERSIKQIVSADIAMYAHDA